MLIYEAQWGEQISYPVLSALQLFPLAAIVLINLVRNRKLLMVAGVMLAVVELALAIDLYRHFDHKNAMFQFAEYLRIAGPLVYHTAVDGVSVLFILLTAFLSVLVIVYSFIREFKPVSRFLTVLFLVQSCLMSTLVTMNLLWFVLMSALQLLPISYLLWKWSTSPEKDMAVKRFMQFMIVAVLLLLVGALMLAWNHAGHHGGDWTFELNALAVMPIPETISSVVFFLLFYGMAIRVPLFPLHGWLPVIAEHGTVAIAPVFLLGIKTGIYGMYRFLFPIMSDAINQWHAYVVGFAVAGVFYAALLALLQVNIRRLMAYAVVSHTSILVIGLFSLNNEAFMGSIMLSATFGIAISGLLFMAGIIYQRTGTSLFQYMGGLMDRIPLVGITFLLCGLAIVGMPGTPGFDAAHLVMEAAIHRYGALVTIAAAVGNVVAAGFLLRAFQRAFLAARADNAAQVRDNTTTLALEHALALILIMVLIATGFYSEPWLDLIAKSVETLGAVYIH